MKIIDNKKDYYDYIAGKYGIDNDVVLDRRQWRTIPYMMECGDCPFEWYFSQNPEYGRSGIRSIGPKTIYNGQYGKFPFFIDRKKHIGKPVGEIGNLVVEIGTRRWVFCVERYMDNGKPGMNIIGSVDCMITPENKASDSVVSIYEPYMIGENNFSGKIHRKSLYKWERNIMNDMLLKDTFIAKRIPAEDAYNAIYNWLLYKKEPVVIDTRTDLQKIDSHGFDRKTSFRKM